MLPHSCFGVGCGRGVGGVGYRIRNPESETRKPRIGNQAANRKPEGNESETREETNRKPVGTESETRGSNRKPGTALT